MNSARLLTSAQELARHDAWVSAHAHGSLWQSAAWRKYQAALGRQTYVYVIEQGDAILAAASIIVDTTVGGFSVWECPRGPLWSDERALQQLLDTLEIHAKQQRCLKLLLSPPVQLPALCPKLRVSGRHVHPEATLLLDLTTSEDELLSQMHPKGRYNIRVAEKQGVNVVQSSDIDTFYNLITSTSQRDGFKIHQKSHYTRFLESLDSAFLLIAMHAEKPIAGLLGVTWKTTGMYYYGASAYEHRALMAPYALQWAAMRHCKASGCTRYDLLGIDAPEAVPTAWKGITDFKRKFGGTLNTYPPEQQLLLKPVMNAVIELKRKIVG